jgi:hypothetical protein
LLAEVVFREARASQLAERAQFVVIPSEARDLLFANAKA